MPAAPVAVDPSATNWRRLPFAEAIDFFRAKTPLPTEHWDDILNAAHDRSFIVAGVTKADLLNDLNAAVDAAIANGETLEQFRARFDQIVAKYGWDYNGSRDWRSRVIYETNVRTAYSAGR